MPKSIESSYPPITLVERIDPEGNSDWVEFPNCHPELRVGDLHVLDSDTGEVCAFFTKGVFVSFRHIKAEDAA